MGLHVHSLSNIPKSENRDYLIYLLEYGWHEPLADALNHNFYKMAGIAAQNRAVVIKGTELAHFENEVFSWHQIDPSGSIPQGQVLPRAPKTLSFNLRFSPLQKC